MKVSPKGLGSIVGVLVVILLLAGGYLICKKIQVTKIALNTHNIETSDWKTYTNSKYGFEITYPSAYDVTDKLGVNNTSFDREYYEGTPFTSSPPRIVNFSARNEPYLDHTGFTIFADTSTSSVHMCLKVGDGRDIIQTKEVNGNIFYVVSDKVSDAAMGGQRGQVSEYRMLRNNTCYIFDSDVFWHIVGYGGYINTGVSDATVEQTRAQQEAIAKRTKILEAIMASLTFIPQHN